MNAKYCKLIRKVARDWRLSAATAKRIKKSLKRHGIKNPPVEFLDQVMQSVHSKLKVDKPTTNL